MSYVINSLILFFFFIFFSISILGAGLFLKNKLKDFDFNFGEVGIIGFLLFYIFSVVINFFLPLNIWITLPILILSFLNFFTNIREFKPQNLNLIILIIFLSFLSSLTVSLHDDHLLYQIPYIKYKQEFKIIFGLISLNDFLAYSHGLYDTMAFFKIPFFENRLVFLIPVIFYMFFIFALLPHIKNNQLVIKSFIFFIFFLTLLKFTRTKEFGTDIPVIALLFLIQIYFLKFYFEKNNKYFFKILIFFSLAMIYKIYAILSIFYFLIFFKNIKEIIQDFLNKQKFLLLILFFLTLITFSKNIIQSGCIIYPASITCFDKNKLSWSVGKEMSSWREDFLNGGVKGWMPYVRENDYQEKITPKQYKEKFRYGYHKNVIKDPDTDRVLIVILILIVTISLTFLTSRKKSEKFDIDSNKIFITAAFMPFLLWLIQMPYVRYGGYAYLPFFLLFSISNIFKSRSIIKNYLKVFLVLSIIFFSFKNILRINNELKNIQNIFVTKTFPIPIYKKYGFETKKNKNHSVYISNHNFVCGITPLPCLPGYWENMHLDINKFFGYLIIKSNEREQINILEEKLKIYNLTQNRYDNNFDKSIRYKK